MKRKLIKLAGKTMVISLPIEIVKKYGLNKGQELDLQASDGKISILLEGKQNLPPFEVKAKTPFLKKQLESLYFKGYDEIKFFYENKTTFNDIVSDLNSRFVGFQVLESNRHYCIIKSIVQEDDSKLSHIVRRLFFLLLGFMEDPNKEYNELTRLVNVCKRIVHNNMEFSKAMLIFNLVSVIGEISKLKIPKNSRDLIKKVYSLYYKFHDLECSKLKEEIEQALKVSKKSDQIFFYNLQKILDLVIQRNCVK